jgi:hypothetical protein
MRHLLNYGRLHRLLLLIFVVANCWPQLPIGMAQGSQQKTKEDPDLELAKKEALSALTLLHQNQISKLYREKMSELQKSTGLTSEARAIAAFGPSAQATPGAPRERKLLFAQRSETLPVLFQGRKADFYSFVFLAKYPAGDCQEEVYMVKEKSEWKVAGIGIRSTF